MLIELEEWEKAVNVLDGLVEEDDEIVDPWYLLGKALKCLLGSSVESEPTVWQTEPNFLIRQAEPSFFQKSRA